MTLAHALVVGGGGLLGSAVLRELERRGTPGVRAHVPWDDRTAAVAALVGAARDVHEAADGPWVLAWCAGAGVVGASPQALGDEVAVIGAFVDALLEQGAPTPSAVFFASSAGAVYSGSSTPPFSEASEAKPLGDYGIAKLRAEAQWHRLAPVARVVVGRITNLYGPGQDLTKNQGLISRLCVSDLRREPIGVYVSLDTIRDYLFADDCGALVCDLMERALQHDGAAPVTKILASHQPASIAHLLGECRRVFGHRVLVRMASSSLAVQQARDLRVRSVVWPELDRRQISTLVHGIHATHESLRAQMAAAGR